MALRKHMSSLNLKSNDVKYHWVYNMDILYYSNYCKNSKKVLQSLAKTNVKEKQIKILFLLGKLPGEGVFYRWVGGISHYIYL